MSDNQYVNQTIRRSVYLERLKQSLVDEFGLTIQEIDKVIGDLDVDSLKGKQLDKALNKLELELVKKLGIFANDYKAQLKEIFSDCLDFEAQSLNKAYAVEVAAPTAIAAAFTAAMTKPLAIQGIEGVIFNDLLDKFTTEQATKIRQAVLLGVSEGKTNQQLIQLVRGTRANKFNDGILATTTRHAEAIVRTGVQTVANEARSEISRQNSDIVIGEQILATLDGRTSQVCRSLDGRVFKVGEGRRPPFHINCRSTFIVVIDPKYAGKGNSKQRASKDGLTDNVSYYEWLKSQPKAFQDDALGKTRAKLFRQGGLSADDFARLNLSKNFEPLTLDEMRAKNPTAFERAGI